MSGRKRVIWLQQHILLKGIHSKEDILAWARSNDWQKLEVLNSIDNTVEFKAYFLDSLVSNQIHHELLSLKMRAGFMWMVHSINFASNQILVYTYTYTVPLYVVLFFLVDWHGALFCVISEISHLFSFYCSYGAFEVGINSKKR
jgi:hypothetical protein